MTFPFLGIALESVLAMREKGQPNSSEEGCVLPAIAKTYLNSLRSAAILYLAASWRWGQAASLQCSRRVEETTRVTQPGFPLKPAGAPASAKHLGGAVIRMQTLLWLDTTWGTGLHIEASLNLKIVKTPSKQRFEQHSVIGSLTASFSEGGKIILGCGIVLYWQ